MAGTGAARSGHPRGLPAAAGGSALLRVDQREAGGRSARPAAGAPSSLLRAAPASRELAKNPNLYLPTTDDVYHPDLAYVGPENVRICQEDGIWGVPDVVCEILSPSTERRDRIIKLRECERAGVPHFWLLDPNAPVAVEEWVLTDGHYVRVSALESPSVGCDSRVWHSLQQA